MSFFLSLIITKYLDCIACYITFVSLAPDYCHFLGSPSKRFILKVLIFYTEGYKFEYHGWKRSMRYQLFIFGLFTDQSTCLVENVRTSTLVYGMETRNKRCQVYTSMERIGIYIRIFRYLDYPLASILVHGRERVKTTTFFIFFAYGISYHSPLSYFDWIGTPSLEPLSQRRNQFRK